LVSIEGVYPTTVSVSVVTGQQQGNVCPRNCDCHVRGVAWVSYAIIGSTIVIVSGICGRRVCNIGGGRGSRSIGGLT